MKNIIYTFLVLFIVINSSAQEKTELDELNSYLKKSNNKTYVNNGILFYKTSSEYSLEYNGSKNKESPIIEFNLKKLIVYRKKYNENNQSFELSLTFRDKEEIEKNGLKSKTISFNKINSDEVDQIIKILKSYYIKK